MGSNSSKVKQSQSTEGKQKSISVHQGNSATKHEVQYYENKRSKKFEQQEEKPQFQIKLISKQRNNKNIKKYKNEDETQLRYENKQEKAKSNLKEKMNEIQQINSQEEKISLKAKGGDISKDQINSMHFEIEQLNCIIKEKEKLKQSKNKHKKQKSQKQKEKQKLISKHIPKKKQTKKDKKKDNQTLIERNNVQLDSQKKNKKEIQLQSICQKINKQRLNQLENIMNLPEFNIILNFVNNFNTKIEKILLDIFEILINSRFQQEYQENIFFESFDKSGFLLKIVNQIKKLVKIEETNTQIKQYSIMLEQLVRIYLKTRKIQYKDLQMIGISFVILNKNIRYFVDSIDMHIKNNKEIVLSQQFVEDLRRTSLSINSINLIGNEYMLYSWDIQNLFHAKVSSLIHIDCPKEIHCSHQIILPSSPNIQQFKAEILYSLINFFKNNPDSNNYLLKQHNLIIHLSPLFNYFVKQNQHYEHDKYKNIQQILFISPPIISFSLNLLHQYLQSNHANGNVAYRMSDLISSLLNILKCMFDQYNIQIEEQLITQIRCNCLYCLTDIQNNGSKEMFKYLLANQYIHVLINTISIQNECYEQNQIPLERSLTNIKNFISSIQNSTSLFQQQLSLSFSQQKKFQKISEEQLEEEGVNEEMCSQMVNQIKNVRISAKSCYCMILHYFNLNYIYFDDDEDNDDSSTETDTSKFNSSSDISSFISRNSSSSSITSDTSTQTSSSSIYS